MTDIRITREGGAATWDFEVADGDLTLVTDRAELAGQLATYRLLTWSGESVYDRSEGIPYVTGIFGRQPLEHVVGIFLSVLQGSPFVDEVLDPTFDLDTSTRELTASARLRIGADETTIGVTVTP